MRGITSGALLFIGFALGGALIALLAGSALSSFVPQLGMAGSYDGALLGGFATALSVVAMTMNLAVEAGSQITYVSVLGTIPILLVASFLVIRQFVARATVKGLITNLRSLVIFALSIAMGFLLVAYALALVLMQSVATDLGVVSAIGLANTLIGGGFISIVAIWRGLSEISPKGQATLRLWLNHLFNYLAKVWAILAVSGLSLFLVFKTIEPDFGPATPFEPTGWGGVGTNNILIMLLALAVVVTVLPLFLYYLLAISMGAGLSFGVSLPSSFESTLSSAFALLGVDLQTGSTIGISSLSPFAALALILLSFLAATIAGAAASRRSSYFVKHIDLLPIAAFIGVVFFFLQRFLSFGFESTNLGKLPHQISNAELPLEEVRDVIGLSGQSVALLSVIITLGFYLGGGAFRSAIDQAYSSLVGLVSGKTRGTALSTVGGTVLGTVTAVLLMVVTAVPLAVATTERIWASIDSPSLASSHLFNFYKSKTISDLKGFVSNGSGKWLDSKILDSARSVDGYSRESRTVNNLGELWRVGDTSTSTSYVMTKDDRSFELTIDSSATVEKFWVLDHPKFRSAISAATISFEAPEALKSKKSFKFEVNGQPQSFGSFTALPGTYRVTAPGFGLLGELDHEYLVSSGQTLSVDLGANVAIPDATLRELSSAISGITNTCGDLDNLPAYVCPTLEKLEANLDVVEGSRESGAVVYVGQSRRELKQSGVKISDSDVSFKVTCEKPETTITALYEGVLPSGAEKDFDTSVTFATCKFSIELTRKFTDKKGSYTLDLAGNSSYGYFIVGHKSAGDIVTFDKITFKSF